MSKTYTGGYRLVSLAFIDLALAVTAVAVSGLGDALGVKSRKRVVLTDIVVSGEKKNDLSVQVKKDGNNYIIEDVYGYDLSIDANGNLTSSEHSSGGAGGTKLYKHNITIIGTAYSGPMTIINDSDKPFSYKAQSGSYQLESEGATILISQDNQFISASMIPSAINKVLYIKSADNTIGTLFTVDSTWSGYTITDRVEEI